MRVMEVYDEYVGYTHFYRIREEGGSGQIFAKLLPNGSRMGVRENFRLLKYEHIIYSFETRNLEILNM